MKMMIDTPKQFGKCVVSVSEADEFLIHAKDVDKGAACVRYLIFEGFATPTSKFVILLTCI